VNRRQHGFTQQRTAVKQASDLYDLEIQSLKAQLADDADSQAGQFSSRPTDDVEGDGIALCGNLKNERCGPRGEMITP
jgi:hypothetical protein